MSSLSINNIMALVRVLRESLVSEFSKTPPLEDNQYIFTYEIHARNASHARAIMLQMDGYVYVPDAQMILPDTIKKWGQDVLDLKNIRSIPEPINSAHDQQVTLVAVKGGTYNNSYIHFDEDNNHHQFRCHNGKVKRLSF